MKGREGKMHYKSYPTKKEVPSRKTRKQAKRANYKYNKELKSSKIEAK